MEYQSSYTTLDVTAVQASPQTEEVVKEDVKEQKEDEEERANRIAKLKIDHSRKPRRHGCE